MISDILKEKLQKSLGKLGLSADKVIFEHPGDFSHGDYSTNIALILSKKEKNSPKELAEKIVENLEKPKEVEKIDVAGAGFINFHLTKEFFASSLKDATKESFGKNKTLAGKKVILEYTDPNPFKIFHIGHLMTNTIGESLSRIAEFGGADVRRVNYQGDVGLHIAKAIWSILKDKKKVETNEDLGEAYSKGSKSFEEDEKAKEEIIEINKKIYSREDEEINRVYDQGKEISLDNFEKMYEKLGTEFDKLFFESETGKEGREIVESNANLFQKSDGAIVFKGENYGLHTRVFINSVGLPTYEAKELGLAKIKDEYFSYDESYVITGNEVNAYFDVLLEVMKHVYEKEGFANKTTHIGHGMLRLSEGKMSSRTGDVISADSLLGEIQDKVLEVMEEREVENREEVAEMVAISALKYSILKQGIGRDIIFNFDKSISFEGDSGPYLQYTTVRAKSVLDIAKAKGLKPSNELPDDWESIEIERMLYKFPEVILRAWQDKSPQLISKFLIDLAGSFNGFYATQKIVEEGGEYKIFLTKAVANTLKNGLHLLGIKIPEKM
tara:strand:- start:5675 stop:7339 length:1665 start_codon:yes stop_codon:yes gene_type:complete